MPTRRAGSSSRAPAEVETAIRELGIEIVGGDEFEVHGRCPKHLERTGKFDRHPSWSVNRSTGLHGCFSCGYSGNFQHLVMDLRFPGDAFRASRWIRAFGIDLQAAVDQMLTWDDKHAAPDPARVDLDIAGEYAMYTDPPAWACQARGLTQDSCEHYGVRWDTRRDSWILPIRLPDGVLVGWQVKAQDGRLFRNYPSGVPKSRALFGYEVFPRRQPALVLESPLDVVRLHTAGLEGGLATYGARWSETQMRLIAVAASEVIAGFDNDEGGKAANALLLHGDRRSGRKPWVRRLKRLRFLNYDCTDAKDVGGMDDESIAWAIEHSRHWGQILTAGVGR